MNLFFSDLYQKVRKLNEVRKTKTIVLILSAMRTGSTLLKALLANAPDTSHLSEIDFQKYHRGNAWKLKTLSDARIIILKKPAGFDRSDYPLLPPLSDGRIIVLVRDVSHTVVSLKKMLDEYYPQLGMAWTCERLVADYWVPVYKAILHRTEQAKEPVFYCRYEDLVKDPMAITAQLFTFIGSEQQRGVSTYFPPKDHSWQWGNDDGGRKIRSLAVEDQQTTPVDPNLLTYIHTSESVIALRKRLGYLS
jgi:hypothetical protein